MGRCACSEPGSNVVHADTDTIDMSGSGTAGSPLFADAIIDPDPDNILSATASGLLVDGAGLVASTSMPFHTGYMHTTGTRATGYGDAPEGIWIPWDFTITEIRYVLGTADGTPPTTVELEDDGVAIVGTSANGAVSPGTEVTGSFLVAANSFIRANITAVGASPGDRLSVFIAGFVDTTTT